MPLIGVADMYSKILNKCLYIEEKVPDNTNFHPCYTQILPMLHCGCNGCDADNGILNFNEPFIIIISGVIDTKTVNACSRFFLSKLFRVIACRSLG